MVGSQRMRRYAATFEAQLYLSILPVLNDRPVLNIRRRTTTYGAIAMMVPNMPTANHNQGEFQFQNSFFACSCVPGCDPECGAGCRAVAGRPGVGSGGVDDRDSQHEQLPHNDPFETDN